MKTLFPLLILLLSLTSNAQQQPSMISEVKRTLSFIFLPNPSGELIPSGTAFFVAVNDEKHTDRAYVYLVTAKHVLQTNRTNYYDRILVRLNRKDGGSDLVSVPLTGTNNAPPIFTHADKNVDLAVIPLPPDGTKYDVRWIPDSMLVTKETFDRLRIKEGDDVFFGGLFIPFPGA